MTKVMLDARYLGPKPSGIGRYCVETVSEVRRLRPELSFGFIVRRPGDAAPLAGDDGGAETRFDAEPYGPRTSLRLGSLIGKRPADLFHSPFHVLPAGLECPCVLTMHDDFNFDQRQMSNYPPPVSWLEWAYFMLAVPDSLRRARRIICVSKTTAEALAARVPSCRPKLRVVLHGVTGIFRPLDEAEARSRCQRLLGFSDPFVLSIGAVSPNKNHAAMLRAFARTFGAESRVRLVRVSRFGKDGGLLRLARELGVRDRYVPLEPVSDEDMAALYGGALFLAFCSIREGFGLPVVEAMASGCPVLTSNLSCLPEIGGDAAAYADPLSVEGIAEKMRALGGDAALREELRGRGLERARSFTWERAARETLAVYDEALAGA